MELLNTLFSTVILMKGTTSISASRSLLPPSVSASSDHCTTSFTSTESTVVIVHPPKWQCKVIRIPLTAVALASSGSHERRCRVQLNTGAMLSLVTTKLAKTIGAHQIRETAVTITRIGEEIFSPHQVKIALRSMQRSEIIVVRANVVDSILECLTTGQVPSIEELSEFSNLDLADPNYGLESRIDVLLDVGLLSVPKGRHI